MGHHILNVCKCIVPTQGHPNLDQTLRNRMLESCIWVEEENWTLEDEGTWIYLLQLYNNFLRPLILIVNILCNILVTHQSKNKYTTGVEVIEQKIGHLLCTGLTLDNPRMTRVQSLASQMDP